MVRVNGKSLVSWGKSKDEALAKLDSKRKALLTEGESVRQFRSKNAQTVGRLCELWLSAIGEKVPLGIVPADISRRIAQSGVDAYRSTLSRNVLRSPQGCSGLPLGDIPVSRLKRNDVVQLLEDMRKAGLSTSVRQNVRGRLIQVMAYGMQLSWSGASDAWAAVKSTARPESEVVRPATSLTIEQVNQLLETAARMPSTRMLNPLTVLYFAGLRIGELLGLRWEDVDLEVGVIHVRHSLKRERGKMVLVSVKGAHTRKVAALRDVPILPQSAEAFARQLEQQKAEREAAGSWKGFEAGAPEQYVFSGRHGGCLDPMTFWENLRLVAGAGFGVGDDGKPLVRIHAHQTRHTFVTLLRDAGMDFDAIASVVGHANSKVTEGVYDHVTPARQADTFAKVHEALGRQAAGQ